LLSEQVPGLSAENGTLEIVAIARRPGVLSKVAIRSRAEAAQTARTKVGIGADHLASVSKQLDGERIQVVAWQPSARGYIADALGLGEAPPMLLLPAIAHARVLLGEIDVRGIAGWRDLNVVLASALTGWHIRLEPVAATDAWRRLELALRTRRTVQGTVVGATQRGPRLELLGLYAILQKADSRSVEEGQVMQVRIMRMNADEGRIFASDSLPPDGQLPLI
jgi:transcription termination/antitermination protein NusA